MSEIQFLFSKSSHFSELCSPHYPFQRQRNTQQCVRMAKPSSFAADNKETIKNIIFCISRHTGHNVKNTVGIQLQLSGQLKASITFLLKTYFFLQQQTKYSVSHLFLRNIYNKRKILLKSSALIYTRVGQGRGGGW